MDKTAEPTRCCLMRQRTEKSLGNLIKSNRYQIVFTVFRLVWYQTDVSLVPNQSKNGKCNLISIWFNKISKIICLCEHNHLSPGWDNYTLATQELVPLGTISALQWSSSVPDFCEVRKVLGGPLISTPWCRETCQDGCRISSLDLRWHFFSLPRQKKTLIKRNDTPTQHNCISYQN